MTVNGRHGLELIAKVISFVLAWVIVGFQLWRWFTEGKSPDPTLMAFAGGILLPVVTGYVLPSRGQTEPSPSQPSTPSRSSPSSP